MMGPRMVLAALAAVVVAGCGGSPQAQPQSDPLAQGYGELPLTFVANRGQADSRVELAATAPGHGFYLARGEVGMRLQKPAGDGVALALRFLGANDVAPIGEQRTPATFTYLDGGRSVAAPGYEGAVYRGLWPGVDMALRGADGSLKYEFRVRPGADVGDIALAYKGASGLQRDRDGALTIATPLGPLSDSAPVAYQRIGGVRVPVRSAYRVSGGSYGFAVGAYDHSRDLVIDPALGYSTFLGGSSDDMPASIAADAAGNAYVTGYTQSPDFPTTLGAFDRTGSANTNLDAFVSKLDPTGSRLVYSTFVGGGNFDWGRAIAIDGAGNAYVAGQTQSTDFPTTRGAFDRTFNVGSCPRCGVDQYDAFALKLNATGSALTYSTFLGGTQFDDARGIALDATGNAYVAGQTVSSDFPLTAGAFDSTRGGDYDAFVTKLNATGSRLTYSTLLGGEGTELPAGVQVDGAGNAYVAGDTLSAGFPTTPGAFDTTPSGRDAFVTKLNATGTAPVYSTVIGGSGTDGASDLALDAAGDAYLVGSTQSADFPATGGTGPAYALKLDPTGTRLDYATRLSGNIRALAPDADGSVWLTGSVGPDAFVSADAFDPFFAGGAVDAYIARLDPAGDALTFGSFLGGADSEFGTDIALDGKGGVYVAGRTASANFTTTPNAFDRTWAGKPLVFWADGFVAKMQADATTPPVTPPAPAPDAPAMSAPADGATLPAGTVTFDWADTPGAASYEIQIDEVDAFRLPFVESAQPTASQYTTSTLPAGTWFWRVRGLTGDGTPGAWSDTRTVTIAAPEPTATPAPSGPLPAPSLLGPSADARFRPGQAITFDWIQVNGATSYTIQIDDSDRFSAPLVAEQTLSGSSYTTSTLPTTKLWWRVRADDGGAWSPARRFEVK